MQKNDYNLFGTNLFRVCVVFRYFIFVWFRVFLPELNASSRLSLHHITISISLSLALCLLVISRLLFLQCIFHLSPSHSTHGLTMMWSAGWENFHPVCCCLFLLAIVVDVFFDFELFRKQCTNSHKCLSIILRVSNYAQFNIRIRQWMRKEWMVGEKRMDESRFFHCKSAN